MTKSCDLYRHFNKDGELLYIGISLSAFARLCQHKLTAHWFTDIASMTVERFASPGDAARAEVAAIRTEKPKFNKAHNGGNLKYSQAVQAFEDAEGRAARAWEELEQVSPYSIRRNIVCWTPKKNGFLNHETCGTGGLVPYPDYENRSCNWLMSSGGCDLKIHTFNTIERSHFVMSTVLGIIASGQLDADVAHALFWPIDEYRLALPYDTAAPEDDKRFGKYAGDTYNDDGSV